MRLVPPPTALLTEKSHIIWLRNALEREKAKLTEVNKYVKALEHDLKKLERIKTANDDVSTLP